MRAAFPRLSGHPVHVLWLCLEVLKVHFKNLMLIFVCFGLLLTLFIQVDSLYYYSLQHSAFSSLLEENS